MGFAIMFATIATLNMNDINIKTIIYGNMFFISIIAICITIFILLGKKEKQ